MSEGKEPTPDEGTRIDKGRLVAKYEDKIGCLDIWKYPYEGTSVLRR